MNKERDKFLTEAMGECYHNITEKPFGFYKYHCNKCGVQSVDPLTINFSTWEWFGKLIKHLDDIFSDYEIAEALFKLTKDGGADKLPDKLSNWYYEYLKENKDE